MVVMRNSDNLSHEEILRAIWLINNGRSQRYIRKLLSSRQSTTGVQV